MDRSDQSRRDEAIDLYNRSIRLLNTISRLPEGFDERRDRPLAKYYNDLRKDVVGYLGSSELTKLLPRSVWCFEQKHFWSLVILAWIALMVLIDIRLVTEDPLPFMLLFIVVGVVPVLSFAVRSINDPLWWSVSKVNEVAERAVSLHGFLGDLLQEFYPELMSVGIPNSDEVTTIGQEVAHLHQVLAELSSSYTMLTRRIGQLDVDIGVSTEAFRRGAYNDQRDHLAKDRDAVAEQMAQIEYRLKRLQEW